MKKLIFLIGFVLSSQLLANPVKLLHFTVDISESYGEIFATYKDNGDIDHFEWVITHPQDPKDPGESDIFTAKDIRNGTVFKKGLPKRFVKVWGDNFSSHNGGEIHIRVPRNIATGKHTFEKVLIDRLGNDWEVNHTSRDQVSRIHLIVKKFLGIPIGITKFEILN